MNSIYHSERDNFRKNTSKDNPKPIGPPKGHIGTSQTNTSEGTTTCPVDRCCVCNTKDVERLHHKVKPVCDFDGDSMRVACKTYVIKRVICHKCDIISTGEEHTLKKTYLGQKALEFVAVYHDRRLTDGSIAYIFDELYGFKISANAILSARKAIANQWKNAYDNILDELSLSSYVQMDESMYSINGSRGYVWLATNKKATYVVVSSSRKATTLDQYFNTLLEIPVVVDGFTAYNKFKIRQRCWVHLLLTAEKLAVEEYKNKKFGKHTRLHFLLLDMYNDIKNIDTADDAYIMYLDKRIRKIASSYGKEVKFRTTLENAIPDLFTFLRYSGMPLHNNDAEREIRDACVLQRNVRHKLCTPEGMIMFAVFASISRTCKKQGISLRTAVSRAIRDSDWCIFRPPKNKTKPVNMMVAYMPLQSAHTA